MEELDLDDPRPPYQQLADRLATAIKDGKLEAGQQLPSHRALAANYGVAEGTVKRALAVLRDQGLVVTRHGMGSYVRAQLPNDTQDAAADVLAEVQRELAALTLRMEAVERRLATD